jgi:hypothetical protein
MASVRTIFRAVVMIATGMIIVKGWQLYGPPAEKVQSFAAAALEKAQAAWNGTTDSTVNPPTAPPDPRSAAPPVFSNALPAATPALPQLVPLPTNSADAASGLTQAAAESPAATLPPSDDAVGKLLAQLEQLGAEDAEVVPWGSGGQLYRCFCRAKVADTSPLARHFEAVAGAPTAAVEQVVAKVEAWRTEQRNELR